jgi:hypothetical protein
VSMQNQAFVTNYAAHALDALRMIEREFAPKWITSKNDLNVLRGLIRKGEKFLLPANGNLLWTTDYKEHFFDLMRLPFPVVALEIPVTNSDSIDGSSVSKSLLIAWTKEAGCGWPSVVPEDDAINFTEMIFFEGEWRLRPGVCGFSPTGLDFRGGKEVAFDGSAIFPEYFGDCTYAEVNAEVGGMFSSGFNTLLEFCLAVNCENVAQSKVEPSKTLNQSRASKGKVPFFTYRFLDIPGAADKSQHGDGTRSGPRVHLRRGHLRRLSNGHVAWVRHTMVGDVSLGVVEKTYIVS